MDACTVTEEAQQQPTEPMESPETVRLRNALRETHMLARKYLTLTGGGRSDGSDVKAVERAAALLGIKE